MKHSRTRLIWVGNISLLIVVQFFSGCAAQSRPLPDSPGFRPGVLPGRWPSGARRCRGVPEFYVHQYNEDFYIIRQSGCSNYEKPFLYLLFGRDTALLLDTGAGRTEVGRLVQRLVNNWQIRNRVKSLRLIVAHSHAHGDHISGDSQFAGLPGVTLVAPDLISVKSFFGIRAWPESIVTLDLGARVLDVIPIPGHEATSIAIYDRQCAILLTGDTLYPGRLYVSDSNEFARSIKRLVEFTRDKKVAHILGTHIENKSTPYQDYPIGTTYQPDEHVLELGRGQLLELHDALEEMRGRMVRKVMRDFTIWP
jgi:hydroxyacylglutathione hydrolase